ncbi:hypothetical protein HYV21_00685 [Candidatus Microgenomates bacterium]|nr:hypothetical protein [Candidatus Microgenomates bacterium]
MKSYLKSFGFISDQKLRNNLVLDYKEVLTGLKRQASKAAVVLSGGIVEAILINRALSLPKDRRDRIKEKYLELKGEKTEIEKMELAPLIQTLSSLGIITSPQAGRSDILRDYRNLIHPYKKSDRPTKADAISVKKLLDDLIKEFEINEQPEIEDDSKVSQFLTHSAWRQKREKPEYLEILKLFYEKRGHVAFEEFLKLSAFKSKPNPSKSLISNLTYLKSQGLCNYDVDSWRGYPINRYESWSMGDGVVSIVEKYLKNIDI